MHSMNAREIVRLLGAATLCLAAGACNAPRATPDSPAQASVAQHNESQPADDPDPQQPAAEQAGEALPADYLPLAIGSRWEYDVTIELPLVGSQQASAVTQVEGPVEIGGKTYCKVVTEISGAPVNPRHVAFYRPGAEGAYQILEGEEEHGEWLYLPRRLEVGQKWTAQTGPSKFSFEVADRRDVDCLGKTYENCVLILIEMQSKFGSMKQEQWLAPGVGPVKQVDHHALFDSTAVLKKYVAGQPPSQSPAQ